MKTLQEEEEGPGDHSVPSVRLVNAHPPPEEGLEAPELVVGWERLRAYDALLAICTGPIEARYEPYVGIIGRYHTDSWSVYRYGLPLSSAYGLAKHRDGRWEWAIAPGVSPSPRYQHAAVGLAFRFSLLFFVFVNARLHVSGGALGGGRMVEDSSSIAGVCLLHNLLYALFGLVLDTAAGVWCDMKSVVTSPRTGRYSVDAAGGDASVELTRRCRHAAAAVGDLIFIYGGLRGGKN
ncbi:hypothetical protein BHE74_00008183 [Ensete ventricosum]|nr:hypothetical protein BHE74_00008183 [Ensete ventricosum]